MKPPAPPDPCPKCNAQATLRKQCSKCGEGVWVYEHGEHYKWGNEVVPCRCATMETKEVKQLRAEQLERWRIKNGGKPTNPKSGRNVTTPEMARKAAEGLARGLPAARALREAGFPPSTVRRSRKGINSMIRAELKTFGRKYIEIGRQLTAEDQELMVRGMLAENVMLKSDRGVSAAKQLGADKRIAMWQPDSQVGLVVLQAPEVPKIKHEVPWLPRERHEEEEEKGAQSGA